MTAGTRSGLTGVWTAFSTKDGCYARYPGHGLRKAATSEIPGNTGNTSTRKRLRRPGSLLPRFPLKPEVFLQAAPQGEALLLKCFRRILANPLARRPGHPAPGSVCRLCPKILCAPASDPDCGVRAELSCESGSDSKCRLRAELPCEPVPDSDCGFPEEWLSKTALVSDAAF